MRRASTLSLVPSIPSCPHLLSATTSCWTPSQSGCWCLRAPQSITMRHFHQSQLLVGTKIMAGEMKRHAGRQLHVYFHGRLHLLNNALYIVKLSPTSMQTLGSLAAYVGMPQVCAQNAAAPMDDWSHRLRLGRYSLSYRSCSSAHAHNEAKLAGWLSLGPAVHTTSIRQHRQPAPHHGLLNGLACNLCAQDVVHLHNLGLQLLVVLKESAGGSVSLPVHTEGSRHTSPWLSSWLTAGEELQAPALLRRHHVQGKP